MLVGEVAEPVVARSVITLLDGQTDDPLEWPGASGPSALLCLVCGVHCGGMDDSTTIELCRALGDPVRLAIVNELRSGTRCACVLAEVTSASPSLLSHHLKTLREAGLISGERRGRWIDYSLAPSVLDRLSTSIVAGRAGASGATTGEVSGRGLV